MNMQKLVNGQSFQIMFLRQLAIRAVGNLALSNLLSLTKITQIIEVNLKLTRTSFDWSTNQKNKSVGHTPCKL